MLLFLALLAPAYAHDHWIEPRPVRGGVAVHVRIGEHFLGAEPHRAKGTGDYTRFGIYSRAGFRDLRPELLVGADPLATVRWTPEDRGTLMVVMDGVPRDITLEAEAFDAYLAEEVLTDAMAARAGRGGPAHERYSRCAKAILARGRPGGAVATQPVGQELEIVPVLDPLTLVLGELLSVQVLFRGEPLAGATVLAARRDQDGGVETWQSVTDALGLVAFAIDGPGAWIVRLIHMVPSPEADAAWRSWWASMTFLYP